MNQKTFTYFDSKGVSENLAKVDRKFNVVRIGRWIGHSFSRRIMPRPFRKDQKITFRRLREDPVCPFSGNFAYILRLITLE